MVYRWLTAATATLLLCAPVWGQTESGCGPRAIERGLGVQGRTFWQGLKSAPRNAIKLDNLKWELPVAATTVLLIEKADVPTADAITSKKLADRSSTVTNVGLGAEIASGALAYGVGCERGDDRLRNTAFTALTAMGEAGLSDLVLKVAFDRQFPDLPSKKSKGDFWSGGRSFPSGHTMTSFAFATAVAHRYPEKKWVKWGAYGLATTVSVLRIPAKHHFPSDVVIGGALGYVVGAYAADHGR